MYKVTPNPPRSLNAETIDPKAADRALSHYLPQDNPPERSNIIAKRGVSQSREETLINASSIRTPLPPRPTKTPTTSPAPIAR